MSLNIRLKTVFGTLILLPSLFAPSVHAGLDNCEAISVSSINFTEAKGLSHVYFKNFLSDISGSHPVYFTNWSVEAKQEVLSVLFLAKSTGNIVDITTDKGCNITLEATELKTINVR